MIALIFRYISLVGTYTIRINLPAIIIFTKLFLTKAHRRQDVS